MNKALLIAQQKKAEMKANGEKVVHKDFYQKAKENPKSRSIAIYAKCWDCAGGGADGKKETKITIQTCQSLNCPLHNFRPYK